MTAVPWMLTTPDVDHSKCTNPACGRPLLGVRAWPVGLVTVATLGGSLSSLFGRISTKLDGATG